MTAIRVGLSLDEATNDLFLNPDGSLALAVDALAVGQHARQRLQTHSGEWFLDTTCGVPWLDQVLGRSYNPALAESLVRAEIMNTDGVTEITSCSVSFERNTRGVVINEVNVLTMFDQEVQL
ncbi:hypothetical protein [Agrobacterium larrymoorei]|uniref:hypothetical protein n=1 Tax=Agrobacterium larrymoorei TaxID=160699 RepID=UPI0030BFAEE4